MWQPEQKEESAEAAAGEAAAAEDVAGGGWLRRRTRVGVVSYVMVCVWGNYDGMGGWRDGFGV